MCFFYGSLMNYWSFLYLVSALTPLEFQSAVLSLNPGGLYLYFFHFLFSFSFLFFSSRHLFHVVHIFIFHGHRHLLRPQTLSPLALCSISLHTLHPPVLLLFPTRFPFSLPVSPGYIIPITMVLFFFCNGFFLNLHSHLSPPLPLATSPLK